MYQSAFTQSPPQAPYIASTSPPVMASNAYRASPVPAGAYQSMSPPPPVNGAGYPVAPRYSNYAPPSSSSRSPAAGYAPPNRYSSPMPPRAPANGGGARGGYGQSSGAPAHPSGLPPAKHKGTLAPGQLVKVGDHQVKIERYLSEGGYAHVYLTSSEAPIYPPTTQEKKGRWGERGYTQHCLKRIAFEDESVWADVRKEIEVMVSWPPLILRLRLISDTESAAREPLPHSVSGFCSFAPAKRRIRGVHPYGVLLRYASP
jgi:AP2-associated kinase